MADLKSCRVLVTPRSYGQHDPRLRSELEAAVAEVVYSPSARPLTSEELQRLLPGCHGYIAGLDAIDRAALAAADELVVIARYGVGVDKVDLAAAKEKGIVVTNTPGANAASVAELTVGLMLCLARSIPQAHAATKAGEFPRLEGVSLEGKVVSLLGFGAIGKQVARRLRGFDCTVLAYDPAPDVRFAEAHDVRICSRDEVVSQADFLSLHVPVSPETRRLVNVELLRQMKHGAYLLNTARGELVDEAALLEALQSGHLRGAALDAFASEPPGADNPLLALPQVIATPHTGAHADGATSAMGWMALRDCLAVLRGEAPAHHVV
jgi:D-3-phosphoglycerate dehydrogenase / 2-oxoglutarate reductase